MLPGEPGVKNIPVSAGFLSLVKCPVSYLAGIADSGNRKSRVIYNKSLAKKTIETAKEFIEAAEFSFSQQNWSAFADNLFSAAELLAKATLLATWSDPKFREKTTHSAIRSRYNRFAHLGNINPLHAPTFNKLSEMRYPARYSKEEFSLLESEGQSLLNGVKSMLQETSLLARAN